jgi:hypothetical protein
MPTYTKLAADGTDLPADATGHLAVRVEHPLLARPIIVSAYRSSKRMPHVEAMKYAEAMDAYGWAWRAPSVEEALFIPDRSKFPALDKNFFPDFDAEEYEPIWTSSPDAESPSGYAWLVYLYDGDSGRFRHSYQYFVRGVRAGQY